jgi:hypothetical protein
MFRSIGMATLAASALLAVAHQNAAAQGVGLEIYPGPPAGAYYDPYVDGDVVRRGYPPRVYGYRSYEPGFVVRPRGGCGQYHYWDGERCLDARVVPPHGID